MSDKVFDVNAILEPPKDLGATPQGELRNFIRQLDQQLPEGFNSESVCIFGAPRGALARIRAAMLAGCDALDVQAAIIEAKLMGKCIHQNDATTCSWCANSTLDAEAEARLSVLNEELMRVTRWHATYNAALTGILARSETYLSDGHGRCFYAVDAADAVHGPLVKP